MKQLLLDYRHGHILLEEVPAPNPQMGALLVSNQCSAVSVGTEKLMIGLANKSLVGKARARPDLVRQVIGKIKADGILEAYRAAMGRLESPVPLGYSCAGEVVDVGSGVPDIRLGHRVACFGSGKASHAEMVSMPPTLCTPIPDDVTYEESALAGVGAIALHSIRMSESVLGERVVVIGLGLLGQIAVQLLKASGCKVMGVDLQDDKIQMALSLGANEVANGSETGAALDMVNRFTQGTGADSVIIFASTPGSEPIELASNMARSNGRIVAPGMVGLDLPRHLFYEKQLSFVVPRSAGPGIYDPLYETKGIDYPLGSVRWTAQRNMSAFLHLVSQKKIDLQPLLSHRFPIDQATEAYDLVLKGKEPYIGVLLTYPENPPTTHGVYEKQIKHVDFKEAHSESSIKRQRIDSVGIGMVGAGIHTRTALLPVLKKMSDVQLAGIASASGFSAQQVGKKHGFRYSTSDYEELLNDPSINLIAIATRHNLHSEIAVRAISAGKHVFIEKPMALNKEQLQDIISAISISRTKDPDLLVMVGFNRRFAPSIQWLRKKVEKVTEPLSLHCTINAGAVPRNHWVHDPEEGGGRIISEVCHFVDLLQFLSGSLIVRVFAEHLSDSRYMVSDNLAITLKMANGTLGSISYVSGGAKAFPRERVEVFGGGTAGVVDNFQSASYTRQGRTQRFRHRLGAQRGHKEELERLVDSIHRGLYAPVPFEKYVNTTLTTLAIQDSLASGTPIEVATLHNPYE